MPQYSKIARETICWVQIVYYIFMKCYHQRYEIRIRFVSLKQRSKIGTGKIVHADYAALLFRIWAFYDKTILDFCFYTIYFWWHVNILSTFLLSIICILKDYFVF